MAAEETVRTAPPAYRIVMLMKRRAGMSVEAFRDYYENHHAPLAAKHAAGLTRYVRRYLDPQHHPENGSGELAYDVMTELWFEDEAVFRRTLAYLTSTVMQPQIVEDEEKLFDRASIRIATIIEKDTNLAGQG